MKEKELKSKCCNAKAISTHGEDFGGVDDIHTWWNECTKCKEPCDVEEIHFCYGPNGLVKNYFCQHAQKELITEEKGQEKPLTMTEALIRYEEEANQTNQKSICFVPGCIIDHKFGQEKVSDYNIIKDFASLNKVKYVSYMCECGVQNFVESDGAKIEFQCVCSCHMIIPIPSIRTVPQPESEDECKCHRGGPGKIYNFCTKRNESEGVGISIVNKGTPKSNSIKIS